MDKKCLMKMIDDLINTVKRDKGVEPQYIEIPEKYKSLLGLEDIKAMFFKIPEYPNITFSFNKKDNDVLRAVVHEQDAYEYLYVMNKYAEERCKSAKGK